MKGRSLNYRARLARLAPLSSQACVTVAFTEVPDLSILIHLRPAELIARLLRDFSIHKVLRNSMQFSVMKVTFGIYLASFIPSPKCPVFFSC